MRISGVQTRTTGRQVAQATKVCKVLPNICGPSVWNLHQVILLALRILRWLLDYWKIFATIKYCLSDFGI